MLRIIILTALVFQFKNVLTQGLITPPSLNPLTDTYVSSQSPTTSYGSATTLNVSVAANGSAYHVRRILVHFNLNSIPSNAVITAANLEFYSSSEVNVTNTNIKVERIDPSSSPTLWNGNVTWSTQPSTLTADLVSTSSLVSGYRTFNVLNHVRNMKAGVYPNYGWMVKMVDETSISNGTYASNATFKPRLSITYYLPYSINSATITHASSSLATNGSINVDVINGPSSTGNLYQWFDGATNQDIVGATTSILTNIKSGWYGLRVSGGSPVVTFYMAFLVGIKCQNATINFKPDGNYMDDAVVVGGAFELNNYGTYNSNYTLRTENSGNIYDSKTYLKPRIWYDPSFNFTTADLTLRGNNHVLSGSNATELKLSNANWSETQITWSNMPSLSPSPQIVIPSTVSAYEDKVISILPFVNLWKSNNLTNYGAALQLQSFTSPQKGMNFHSSDATVVSKRPAINFVISLENLAGCNAASINDLSYSELKDNLDAGYARTVQGKFRFSFFEEGTVATGKYIPFEIRNENNVIVATSTIDGVTTGSVSPLLYSLTSNGSSTSICELNIASVPNLRVGKFFTLIVTNTSGEKKYLRIFYQN